MFLFLTGQSTLSHSVIWQIELYCLSISPCQHSLLMDRSVELSCLTQNLKIDFQQNVAIIFFFIFSYCYLMLLLKHVYVLCEDCQLLNPLKEKPPDRLEISPHPHVKEQKSNDEYVCINLESRFLVPCQRLKYYLLSLRFDRESTCCL